MRLRSEGLTKTNLMRPRVIKKIAKLLTSAQTQVLDGTVDRLGTDPLLASLWVRAFHRPN